MASVYVFRFFLFFHFVLVLSAGHGNGKHDKCPTSFECGQFGSLHFPFTKPELQHCGFITIHGCDDDPSSLKAIQLEKNGKLLPLTNVVQQENLITVFDRDLHTTCEVFNSNKSLPLNSPLASFHLKHKANLFRCNHDLHIIPPAGFINHVCPEFDVFCHDLHLPPPPPILGQPQTSLAACLSLQLPCKNLEMATLQKFKLLATQCGMARSPTRSPRTSPMVQFRRRKTTLRMLLNRHTGRRSPPRQRNSPIQKNHLLGASEEKKKEKCKELMRRNSLKQLFVSSPPREEAKEEIPTRELDSVGTAVGLGGPVIWSNGAGSRNPVWRSSRIRLLLMKSWRPGLDPVFE